MKELIIKNGLTTIEAERLGDEIEITVSEIWSDADLHDHRSEANIYLTLEQAERLAKYITKRR